MIDGFVMTARRVKSAGFDGIEIHSANGGLGDPARAAELIVSGQADVVALGKAALANYDWVNKVATKAKAFLLLIEWILKRIKNRISNILYPIKACDVSVGMEGAIPDLKGSYGVTDRKRIFVCKSCK